MWGIHLFSEAIDEAGSYVNLAGITDQTCHVTGDYIYVPLWNLLFGFGACMGATTPGHPYLQSPSLRQFGRFDLVPVNPLVTGLSETTYRLFPDSPVKLEPNEGLECLSNADPGSAEYHSVILFMTDKPLSPVTGQIAPHKFTSSISGNAGVWTSGNITFSTELPVGNYAVVGMSVYAANCLAARLIFNNQVPRPGVPVNSSNGVNQSHFLRYGQLGQWGVFHTTSPPQIEIFAVASCTSQIGYLDIMRVS